MKSYPPIAAFHAVAVTLTLCAPLSAADLLVDASATPGTYPTIQAAINAAQPGDRILVMPGSYPAFSVTKSITILGLGTSPGSVIAAGVHLGLGFPNQNYHVSIGRLRLDAGPFAPLAVSGQELGVGQIEFESVEVAGGFRLLVGEPGFVLSLANCTVIGDIGQGFDGATCNIAAPAPSYVSITRSRFQGARGDLFAAQPPLAGLLLDRGVTAEIAQCSITGGRGGIAQAGAAGLEVRQAQVRMLGTGSMVTGGNGGTGAAGGAGLRTTSTVFHGSAMVAGGAGTPNGAVVSGGGTLLPAVGITPELEVRMDQALSGPAVVGTGTRVAWQLDADGGSGLVVMSIALGNTQPAPLDRIWLELGPAVVMPNDVDFVMPPLGAFVGLPVFCQGIAVDPANNAFPTTAPYALHIDG